MDQFMYLLEFKNFNFAGNHFVRERPKIWVGMSSNLLDRTELAWIRESQPNSRAPWPALTKDSTRVLLRGSFSDGPSSWVLQRWTFIVSPASLVVKKCQRIQTIRQTKLDWQNFIKWSDHNSMLPVLEKLCKFGFHIVKQGLIDWLDVTNLLGSGNRSPILEPPGQHDLVT